MNSDATFRYGGALIVGLIAGFVLGFAVSPLFGLLVGPLAAVAWLVVGLLTRRSSSMQRQR